MNEPNLGPVAVLAFLLMVPAFVAGLLWSVARGIRGLPIPTHLGVKGGTVARIYAVLYLIILGGLALYTPRLLRTSEPILRQDILASALSPFRLPLAASFLFLIMGAALMALDVSGHTQVGAA